MSEQKLLEPVVLALDVGTSSTRAALYDARGDMLPGSLAARDHVPATTPDGGSELDAEALLGEAEAVLDETLGSAPGITVAAVGTSSLWHSVVGVDARERAVTPVYTWADTRAAAILPELTSLLDPDALYEHTACPLHPSYVLEKLLWLQRTQSQLVASVRCWLSPAEYLHLRFLGETACGEAMASATGLYDQAVREWYPPALAAAGISDEHLAPLVPITQPVGRLTDEYARRWPSLAGAVWYPALGDGVCSNFGSGAGSEGVAALNYGTSGAIRTIVAQPTHFPKGLWLYRVDEARLLLGGAVSNAGNIYAWLLDTLQLSSREAEAHMLRAEPGATGLEFVPHLAGERAPDWTPGATGVLSGLRLDSSREEILQAGVEGVLVELLTVHNMLSKTVRVREMVASGGAVAKSEALRGALTDALGRPLRVCREREPSARGAALLTLEALGVLDAAQASTRLSEPFEPNEGRHRVYAGIEQARAARRPGYRAVPPKKGQASGRIGA